MLHSHYLDLSIDHSILKAEEAVFGMQPCADLRGQLRGQRGTWLFEAVHLVYFSFVPLIVATTGAFAALPALRASKTHFEACVMVSYCACCLSWLAFPVYGPVISLGPVIKPEAPGFSTPPPPTPHAAAAASAPSIPHSMSEVVWAGGKAYASTGTALPSSHCAVTAAMLAGVLRAKARVLAGRGWCGTALTAAYALYVALIWFSVVFCGFHYVSDVVAGLACAYLSTKPLSVVGADQGGSLSENQGSVRTDELPSDTAPAPAAGEEIDNDSVPLLPISNRDVSSLK